MRQQGDSRVDPAFKDYLVLLGSISFLVILSKRYLFVLIYYIVN